MDNDLDKIAASGDLVVYGRSGMDPDRLLTGRPYGGCALVHKRRLRCSVTPIPVNSRRLYACTFEFMNFPKLLIINAYMPCDSHNVIDSDLYREIISEIETIMNLNHDVDYVIIGGDLNTDVSRVRSANSVMLENFCTRSGLRLCLHSENSTVDYTYQNDVSGAESIIDHFIISENLFNCINVYSCLHEGNNLSDHDPVCLSLAARVEHSPMDDPSISLRRSKIIWETASDVEVNAYKHELHTALDALNVPYDAIGCQNFECLEHTESIQNYYNGILSACINSAEVAIGARRARDRHAPRRPGWNVFVQPYKESAIFWHALWKSSGSPREGQLADIRRRSRAKYRYAVRYIKRYEDKCRAERLADALRHSNPRDAWRQVRKVSARKCTIPASVDGVEGEREIGEVFARKMSGVFNSVSYDDDEMSELQHDIERDVVNKCSGSNACYHTHGMTYDDVKNALKNLKAGKRDGTSDFSSDYLLNGPESLSAHLSFLFTAILKHGSFPTEFACSTVIPIPKNRKKSLMCSANYRGIALGSIVAKVFDIVLLNSNYHILKCSDLQYGFRKNHSTVQCTFVLNETIQYYLNGDSPVHVMLLDASQAFDRVEFIRLFRLLERKGICPLVARILLNMYVNQIFRIQWQSQFSEWHAAKNGVKQGGVISPVLFVNYVDELLERLRNSGFGCYVGHVYCGSFSYADDITLLSPTKWALKRMLEICDQYAKDFSMKFNPLKSKYQLFCRKKQKTPASIVWNDERIIASNMEIHLGNIIGPRSHIAAVDAAISDLYRRFNHFLFNFSCIQFTVKYHLFKTLCMSVYGCQLWDFSAPHCERFYAAWRKVIRRLLKITPRAHSRLLPLIVKDLPVDVQLHRRFLKFFLNLLNSGNACTRICAELASARSGSCVSKSFNYISRKYNIHTVTARSISVVTDAEASDAECAAAAAISDFLVLRDETDNAVDIDYINTVLNYICTT